MTDSLQVLPGTVAFLALSAVAQQGPLHGFQILRWVQETSEGDFLLEEGALYPALHRMQKKGWLTAEWGVSDKGRRAKFYDVTDRGRRALKQETAGWKRYVDAVERVVGGEA